jgi:dTDP-4-dehydrorhamnose 3,5-epimerase
MNMLDEMKIKPTDLDGVAIITPRIFRDSRGYFTETFRQGIFDELSAGVQFVQDNQAFSIEANVVRGLHFQSPPFAQAKLIRVLRGRILDVAVDIRRGSPTFGQHFAIELSAENMKQLFVPVGFAHGYQTLESKVEIAYKVTNVYAPAHDMGIFWNDLSLGLPWMLDDRAVMLSDKDKKQPLLRDIETPFIYGQSCVSGETQLNGV